MRRLAGITLLLVVSTSAFAEGTKRYLVGTRVVPVKAANLILAQELEPRSFREVVPFESVNAFAIDMTEAEAAKLRKSPNVRYVEEDGVVRAFSDTITPGTDTRPYGVSMIHANDVWNASKGEPVDGGARVHVAILDTGITYDDPDLAAAFKGGFNMIANNSDPRDDNGHGTHVAGTVAAAENGSGVIGVAPLVDIYSLKVLDTCGSGSFTKIIQAVDWVIAKKAEIGGNWVMSLSLGTDSPSQTMTEGFQRAADAGILTFAASGNSYDPSVPSDGLAYPGALSSVVGVGAIDESKNVASFSQRGADLDLVAPGVDVLSTYISESVATDDGSAYSAQLPKVQDALCFKNPTVASAGFVFCGIGNPADFPASVAGKVALIERGDLTFVDKTKNAKAAGAVAVIVYNNVEGTVTADFTTVLNSSQVIPFVTITKADGLALKASPNAKVTLSFGLHGYALENGTSMSTPHASAAAALVWSLAPSATAAEIKNALLTSAQDLGAPGFDTTYGFGLVDALAAAKSIAPAKFTTDNAPAVPGPITTGRRILRRGH